jgi:hypothetical protein
MYIDMRVALSNAEPIRPDILRFGDGQALFYRGQVNSIFGDPETGKTWVALAAVADELQRGNRAAYIDIDHNGAGALGGHLLTLGVPLDTVCDEDVFRVASPGDDIEVDALVADLVAWAPDVVVLDSVGELVPILGGNSNDSDEFTMIHRRVLGPLAAAGAGVIVVDHLAKGAESRGRGPVGAGAKRRIIGGAMLRITLATPFAPGRGGKAHLNVFKDRHGGLRSQVAHDTNHEPLIGEFVLTQDVDGLSWSVAARDAVTPLAPVRDFAAEKAALHEDRVARLLNADHLPGSITEAKNYLKCGQEPAKRALSEAREQLDRAA